LNYNHIEKAPASLQTIRGNQQERFIAMKNDLTGSNPSIERHPETPQVAAPHFSPGEDNPSAILTAEQVLAIYASDEPVKDLAHRYRVNRNTISMIRHGRRWKWLTQSQERQDGAA
jgi:hypothetical protein